MTGIGPVCVRQPRVRDREATEGERIRYSPSILPRHARRSKSLEVLIPILYLKGISTGDFEEALAALQLLHERGTAYKNSLSKMYTQHESKTGIAHGRRENRGETERALRGHRLHRTKRHKRECLGNSGEDGALSLRCIHQKAVL
jgi:RNase P/RNase MRP subunit POP5